MWIILNSLCIDSHWSYYHTVWHCTEHSTGVISVIDNTSKPNMPAVSYIHLLTHVSSAHWFVIYIRISCGPINIIMYATRSQQFRIKRAKQFMTLTRTNFIIWIEVYQCDSFASWFLFEEKKTHHLIVITFGICWIAVHSIGSMHFTQCMHSICMYSWLSLFFCFVLSCLIYIKCTFCSLFLFIL